MSRNVKLMGIAVLGVAVLVIVGQGLQAESHGDGAAVKSAEGGCCPSVVKPAAKACPVDAAKCPVTEKCPMTEGCVCKCPMAAKCAGKMEALGAALDAARKASDAGDAAKASAEIAKAQEVLAACKQMREQCVKRCAEAKAVGDAKPINVKCPIMGGKIDPANAGLTRTFGGKTVGFCCAGCPDAWDKLDDQQKIEKLQAVMK